MKSQVAYRQSDAPLPMHRHEDARIIVVLDGAMREKDISGARIYRKGDVLFRPPFCAHANAACSSPALFMRLPVTRKVWLKFAAEHGWRAASGRLQLEDRNHRAMLQLKCGDAFIELLDVENRAPDARTARFPPDAARVSAIKGEPWAAAAEAIGIKPYQLTRLFARHYGLTPTAFRREARLRRALRMLAATNAGLAHIAAECGYADQSHFSREIKSATGRAPRALRTAMQTR